MFHYTKAVLKVGFPVLFAYFAWLKRYSLHPEKYPFEKRFRKLQKLVKKVTKALQVELIIEGEENIPDDIPSFFTPNHLSFYDPLAFVAISKHPCTFISKIEIKKYPFVGTAVKSIQGLFMDRNDLKQSLKTMMKMEETFIEKEKSWVVFPEGTRRKDHMMVLRDFHHGTFRAPTRAKLPIVPVAIYGTFRILKIKPQYKKYPVFIKFLKPIYSQEYESMTTIDVAKRIQNDIQKEISFNLRRKDFEYMNKVCKKYKFNSSY